MRIRTEFPRRIREIPNTWIELSDGCRLAARIWLPEDAETDPVPAVLEYIPYRKGDGTAVRDSLRHPWFAGHGYAAARVDMRGSGDSDGILLDEYLRQEQDDALEVIAWLAEQPWCTGAVGIMGKSWGGFNGLQIAARRPPALRAVVSVYSTDDRYSDDVHYMGGCVLAGEMLPWASVMLGLNALPPDPDVVGERWREMWRERLASSPPFVEAWLSHQRRDDYWKHGSVCEDFSAIEAPVYAIGGWADGYSNAVPRLLAGLSCPRKGLIGPWGHQYPESAVPGPAIGFQQESLRWWDHWLKGEDTGIMDEPMLRVWMQDWIDPQGFLAERPGRWVAATGWPPRAADERELRLGDGTLDGEGEEDRRLEVLGVQTCGLDAGDWCPSGDPAIRGELPLDQRRDDGVSLCFDSEPLADTVEILGFPEARLAVAVDRRTALVAVRLCDVAPDGTSLLVTRGVLNLSHCESDETLEPLEPGRRYDVVVRMNAIGHSFGPGHRVRLAVSPTYWPHVWPSPEPVTLTVFTGASVLALPVRAGGRDDEAPPPFDPPEVSPPLAVEPAGAADAGRVVEHDVASGRVELRRVEGDASRFLRDGLVVVDRGVDAYAIVEGDPLSAAVSCTQELALARGEWRVRVFTRSLMTADATHFRVTNEIDAYEGETRVHAFTRSFDVPRDHV